MLVRNNDRIYHCRIIVLTCPHGHSEWCRRFVRLFIAFFLPDHSEQSMCVFDSHRSVFDTIDTPHVRAYGMSTWRAARDDESPGLLLQTAVVEFPLQKVPRSKAYLKEIMFHIISLIIIGFLSKNLPVSRVMSSSQQRLSRKKKESPEIPRDGTGIPVPRRVLATKKWFRLAPCLFWRRENVPVPSRPHGNIPDNFHGNSRQCERDCPSRNRKFSSNLRGNVFPLFSDPGLFQSILDLHIT